MYLKFLLALHSNAKPQHIRKSFENVEYRRASERAKERTTSRLEVPAWTMAISLAPPSVQWAYPGAFAQRLPVRTLASQRVGVAREQRRRGERCLEGARRGYTLSDGQSEMTLNKMAAIMRMWPIGGASQCSTGIWGHSHDMLSVAIFLISRKMFGALCKTIRFLG